MDHGIQVNRVDTSEQTAGILAKDSLSRVRWSQLTDVFNLVTTHVRSCSHLCVFVCTDEKMSKCRAELTTESVAAKQRHTIHALMMQQWQFFIIELWRGVDLMNSAILTYSICLARVTLLPAALTKLRGGRWQCRAKCPCHSLVARVR